VRKQSPISLIAENLGRFGWIRNIESINDRKSHRPSATIPVPGPHVLQPLKRRVPNDLSLCSTAVRPKAVNGNKLTGHWKMPLPIPNVFRSVLKTGVRGFDSLRDVVENIAVPRLMYDSAGAGSSRVSRAVGGGEAQRAVAGDPVRLGCGNRLREVRNSQSHFVPAKRPRPSKSRKKLTPRTKTTSMPVSNICRLRQVQTRSKCGQPVSPGRRSGRGYPEIRAHTW
jgi:hypothetical protein